ncbi:hypothetical protein AB1Y20_020390 [Prymnesium parvum]|uniref:Uncharacterized protein n=1 Tax=Prymnesium parvum TaxID=97485 RepID=A0AB34JXZ6_PRYPA
MALSAEEVEATMECDNDDAASGASAGKRPAEAPPMGEPAPARVRPPVVRLCRKRQHWGVQQRTHSQHTPHTILPRRMRRPSPYLDGRRIPPRE